MEILKYFELSDHKNVAYQNLWDAAKAILKRNLKFHLHISEESKGEKLMSDVFISS